MEWMWLKEALCGGMSAAGVRLGTSLTRGWFWARVNGCAILYRGEEIESIDWVDILAVANTGSEHIEPPAYVEHESNSTYFYIVRCANHCGELEDTWAAVARFSTDSDGELVEPYPNRVCGLRGSQADPGKVKLLWFYEAIGQESSAVCFNVYNDGGMGQINFDTPIAQIDYVGRRFYEYEGDLGEAMEYKFAVTAQDAEGNESGAVRLRIQVKVCVCEPPQVLSTEVL